MKRSYCVLCENVQVWTFFVAECVNQPRPSKFTMQTSTLEFLYHVIDTWTYMWDTHFIEWVLTALAQTQPSTSHADLIGRKTNNPIYHVQWGWPICHDSFMIRQNNGNLITF